MMRSALSLEPLANAIVVATSDSQVGWLAPNIIHGEPFRQKEMPHTVTKELLESAGGDGTLVGLGDGLGEALGAGDGEDFGDGDDWCLGGRIAVASCSPASIPTEGEFTAENDVPVESEAASGKWPSRIDSLSLC